MNHTAQTSGKRTRATLSPALAYRQWIRGNHTPYWVAQLPGDGGKDWGYTENSSNAIVLSNYWQRRFRRDCERVGYGDTVVFIPIADSRDSEVSQ